MSSPITPSPLPATPAGTPAWLIRTVSAVVALIGLYVARYNPTGSINTPTAQAVVILGFLVVAAAIFTVHTVLVEIHTYGLSKVALEHAGAAELDELRKMAPEFTATYLEAKPLLAQLPGISTAVDAVTKDVEAIKGKVEALPLAHANVLAALDEVRASLTPKPAPAAGAPAGTATLSAG